MLLRKIRLKNIRSYIEQELVFPDGVTLLSGDIGSGKSTILLAVDFALFGIRRGELSGSALLRNGANEGFVILNFSIDEKDVIIKRTLKKTVNGIVQNSGYITLNDITQELTPVELKQRILDIINYPPEMLTKKSLIYRYTVYTPQEEMKLILLGDKEYRIETLRRVFNIDRYKRIKENSKIVLNEVKQKKKEYLLLVSDLESKRLKIKEIELELIKVKDKIEINKKRLEASSSLIAIKKQVITDFEQNIDKLNEFRNELEIVNHSIKSKDELKLRILNQLNVLEKQVLDLSGSIKISGFEGLKEKIIQNEKFLDTLDKELREITNKRVETKSKKLNSEEIKSKITNLDFCPLCRQGVFQEHKHEVSKREDELIKKFESDLDIFYKKENDMVLKIKQLKEDLQNYRSQEKEYEISKVRFAELEAKKDIIKGLKKEQEDIELLVREILLKKTNLEDDIFKLKDIEINYKSAKNELDILLDEQKKLELGVALFNKDYDLLNKDIIQIRSEIEYKEKAKEKLDYYIKLQDWLDGFFVNLVDLIERKIMLKLHNDFNLLFQKWFSMLMDNDIIKVKLDEEFTPLIEQNSHDIEYENLSGGEKTACALAYRLALNHVINTIMSSVNTKDLIILDEPTDGFSSEQLDKIRGVLSELNMRQVIIVSHESKIESFVDNIIRIKKDGHVSSIS